MYVDVRVMVKNDKDEPFIGIGIVWLLMGVEKYRSVSRAALEMKLSYPKALRIIRNVERGLGRQIVVRHRGGSERGGAELTAAGKDFVKRYDRAQEKIRRHAVSVFEKEFARSPFFRAAK